MKIIEDRKLKKNESLNPMEVWNPKPRIISMVEEVRSLFGNFANESSGGNLEAVLCELFDRESFSSSATADRAPTAGRCMYSLLGGTTKEISAPRCQTERAESNGAAAPICLSASTPPASGFAFQ
jgi:hypothetical protein